MEDGRNLDINYWQNCNSGLIIMLLSMVL